MLFKKQIDPANSSDGGGNPAFPGFERALNPFIIWMKLLTGTNIARLPGNNSTISSISFTLYGILMLLLNFICTASFIYIYVKQRIQVYTEGNHTSLTTNSKATNSTNVSNFIIPNNADINVLAIVGVLLCEFLFICGIHLCYFISQNKFKALWNSLLIIEREFKICPLAYRRIRRSVWIGVVIIPVVSFIF